MFLSRGASRVFLGILLTLLVPLTHAKESAEPLRTVRLALQWQPQSQFAGIYMAREQGIYRAYGLDVVLVHGNAERSALDRLQAGEVELATSVLSDALVAATAWPDATESESSGSGSALAQIAQLVQQSNLMLVAWKDMGVERPEDLDGMRVSVWPSIIFDAFFAARQVTPLLIPQYASINLFLKRGVAACAAMEYNEYHRILQAGVDPGRLTTFAMRDQNLGFPEDGLYATSRWVAQHPTIARAVREATLAGWIYARDHPEEAITVALREAQRAGVPANRPHERWMLSHLLNAIFVPGAPLVRAGILDPDAFSRTAQALFAAGRLTRIPSLTAFAPLEPP